jgi:hypothetical protein
MRRTIVSSAILFAISSTIVLAQAPAPAKPASKAAEYDPRNLNGIWYRTSGFQTFSNVPAGSNARGVTYADAPLTPEGKAKFDSHKPGYGPRAVPPALGNDPMGTCDPLGIPRNLNAEVESSHRLWEIVQTPGKILQFFEWHHDFRIIYTDGRALPNGDDLQPLWNGYSVGHWEGDTLVVDSIGFDERTWLDKFGYPHTEDMKLQEHYRRRDKDTLELVMTITDPEYYSKPWVSDTKVFKLNGDPVNKPWDEQVYCAPSEEFSYNRRIRDVAGGKPQE